MCSSLDSPEIEAELETVHSGVNVQVEFAFFLENRQNYFFLPFSHFSPTSPLHPSSLYSLSPSFFFHCFFSPVLPSCCFFPHSSFFSLFSLLNFSLTSGLPLLYRECQSKCCCEVRKIYFKIMLLVFILTNFEKRSRGW